MRDDALYNEIDPFAAEWLENLIAAGQIAPGVVDRRSIEDLEPDYVRQFRQVHLFAGIGIWSAALRRAGWPDARGVWTISCPCQPFSAAGAGLGFADERHLWPHAFHLITQCGPDRIFGEQVSDKGGQVWFDLVQADLEAAGFAVGARVDAAAGHGAPHTRQRFNWCALGDTVCGGRQPQPPVVRKYGDRVGAAERVEVSSKQTGGNVPDRLAQPHNPERRPDLPAGHERDGRDAGRTQGAGHAGFGGGPGGVADADGGREQQPNVGREDAGILGTAADAEKQVLELGANRAGDVSGGGALPRPGPTNNGWRDADWLFCRDGKWRPVEPGTFPLAHALPRSMGAMGAGLRGLVDMAGLDGPSLKAAKRFRTGTLRGFGNAVVLEQTEAFVADVMEYLNAQ